MTPPSRNSSYESSAPSVMMITRREADGVLGARDDDAERARRGAVQPRQTREVIEEMIAEATVARDEAMVVALDEIARLPLARTPGLASIGESLDGWRADHRHPDPDYISGAAGRRSFSITSIDVQDLLISATLARDWHAASACRRALSLIDGGGSPEDLAAILELCAGAWNGRADRIRASRAAPEVGQP